MSDKKSLVEEAVLQMKNLEDVIAENAKGILASTMKEEINELVKESLKEQDDEEIDVDTMDVDDAATMDTDEVDIDNVEDTDIDDTDVDLSVDDEEEVVKDLTNAPMSDVIKAFMEMGEDDGIIIKKNSDDTISLSDNNTDKNYLIKMGESVTKNPKNKLNEMESNEEMFESEEFTPEEMDELLSAISNVSDNDNLDNNNDDDEFEFDNEFQESYIDEIDEMDEMDNMEMSSEETIYEITLDEEMDEEMDEEIDEEIDEDYDEENEEMTNESIGFKPKGKGFGKPKFNYKKTTGGFKEDKKQGSRGVGMGKGPKFEFKEGETKTAPAKPKVKPGTETERKPGNPMRNPNKENEPAPAKAKKGEHTEAARTLGNGKKWGRNGLNKPRTAPRHLATESVNTEIEMLKSKNDEYRKALNLFRDKLNEVAVFNSNLAYATRLFTEHTTTKQEKINILRRFDGAESIKESKTLYKTIKDELSSKNDSQIVKESVETKINKTPSTGSAINLIESKTYENPQFMRMKDIMQKLIK